MRPALDRLRLALLVEGHDDDRGAVPARQRRLAQELLLAFLERQRVDDRPALDGCSPASMTDHLDESIIDRHPADVRLRGDQVEEARHRRLGVQQRLVHVDVDDLGAAVDLLAGHLDGLGVTGRRGSASRSGGSR